MVYLLVKMGGNGIRFGTDIPKQYVELNGKPLFYWLLEQYKNINIVNGYILVSNPKWIDYTQEIAKRLLGKKLLGVVPGGDTMSKSVYNGVMFARNYLKDDDVLLVHDVTNPVVALEQIGDVVDTARDCGFCALTTEQVHTIYRIDEGNNIECVIPKQEVGSGYSPEGFLFGKIYDCYSNARPEELEQMTSAIALAKAHNARPKAVKSHIINLKITYKEDFDIYKRIVEG